MKIWTQEKYILELSNVLEKFKRVSPTLFNCRCPICGDSSKNKNKARGYIFQKADSYFYHCHNCLLHQKFENFLKAISPELYYQACKDGYTDEEKQQLIVKEKRIDANIDLFFKNSKTINQCLRFSPPYKYLENRKIPIEYFDELRYTENYKDFVNAFFPIDEPKFTSVKHEIPRILIPFIDKNGKLFGFQGRAIDPNEEIRYISIILKDDTAKVYGLNKINSNVKYYIVEGPFDAMFLQNSLAVCGSDVLNIFISTNLPKENAVIVMDNEPRNDDIVRNIRRAIEVGYKTVIWPAWWKYKDINEAILDKVTISELRNIVDEHTYQGLEANLEFTNWRKL